MTQGISPDTLIKLSRLLSDHTGLYFPEKKWPALTRGVLSAANQLRKDVEDLVHALQRPAPAKEILDLLAAHLTIGETYFLRDKNFFQILKDQIIHGLLRHPRRKQKKIIFWSAGCATGEEPYSLAILLDDMLPELNGWDISIIGSDINPRAIEKARAGIYSGWSMRETPETLISRYFTQTDNNCFELVPHIRRMVSFVQANLMEASHPALLGCADQMDVIICRNVLMYFSEPNRNRVIQNLTRSLLENGWLITGPSEAGFVNVPELTPVRFSHALYHRKGPPRRSDAQGATALATPQKGGPTFAGTATTGKKTPDRKPARRITDRLTGGRVAKPGYDVYQNALTDYHQGRYAQSAEKLTALLFGRPGGGPSFLMQAESMMLLARCHANLGDLKNAKKWCDKALGLEKLNPELYYLLATIHQSAGDLDAAVKSLKQAIYLDPEFIMAHFTLAMALQRHGKVSESLKSMNTALSLLRTKDADDLVAYSEGMTASRLIETIRSMTARG